MEENVFYIEKLETMRHGEIHKQINTKFKKIVADKITRTQINEDSEIVA